MKTYSVNVESEEKQFVSSAEESTTELGILLQIWQDLIMIEKKHGKLQQEDFIIKRLLNQILVEEFGEEHLIPIPEYYKKNPTDTGK